MANKSLQHFGVLGMHWGVHRTGSSSTSSSKSHFTRSVQQKFGSTKPQTEHQATVKSLKAQIKAKSDARWNAQQKKFGKDEQAAYEALAAKKVKDLEAHSKQSKNFIDRFIGQSLIKTMYGMDRADVVGKLEDKIIAEDAARGKALKKANSETMKKFDSLYTKRFSELDSKKLNIVDDFKEMLKIDRELSNQLTEELLKNQLKHS